MSGRLVMLCGSRRRGRGALPARSAGRGRRRLRAPSAGRRERGFTLIECLLAITIFSILITSAYSVLRAGVKAERSGDRSMEMMRRVRWLMHDLSRDVRNALAPPGGFFHGGEDRLTLLTLVAAEGGGRVLPCEVSYWLQEDEATGVRTLVRASTPLFGGAADTVRIDAIVRDIAFSFEGAGPEGEKTWLPSWEEREGLPSAVRVELQAADSPQGKVAAGFEQVFPIPADRELVRQEGN